VTYGISEPEYMGFAEGIHRADYASTKPGPALERASVARENQIDPAAGRPR